MNINREQLLQQLESVTPGLSKREIIEQSTCFVFTKGRVITFNDEVACWTPVDLKLEGAVQAEPLLAMLRKLPDETLEVSLKETRIVIQAKKSRTRFVWEKEISLPFKSVHEPKEWKKLPSDFLEAVNLVHRCAGKDEQKLEVYVHLHPERIEACMEHQLGHFQMGLAIVKPVLVRKDSIKHVIALGVTHFGMTSGWIHFRNPKGLILSCRRYAQEAFPDTSKILKISGTHTNLPKALIEVSERASILTADNVEDDAIVIKIQEGKITVIGTGTSGDHRESRKIQYKGKEITFMIDPALLKELCQRHSEAWVSENTLKVKAGKFTFVTALGTMEEKKEAESEETSEE